MPKILITKLNIVWKWNLEFKSWIESNKVVQCTDRERARIKEKDIKRKWNFYKGAFKNYVDKMGYVEFT